MIKLIKTSTVFFLLLLFTFCTPGEESEQSQSEPSAEKIAESHEIDAESIYQLEAEWHSHNNDTIKLSELQGKIPVMAMAFTNCTFACPRIVEDMKNIERNIAAGKKDETVFVLVSFDSENDHPDRLREYAKEMELSDQWLLLHGDEDNVRELSMLLGIKYKKQRDGLFAHSNEIILLDKKGRITKKTEGLGIAPGPVVERIGEM